MISSARQLESRPRKHISYSTMHIKDMSKSTYSRKKGDEVVENGEIDGGKLMDLLFYK